MSTIALQTVVKEVQPRFMMTEGQVRHWLVNLERESGGRDRVQFLPRKQGIDDSAEKLVYGTLDPSQSSSYLLVTLGFRSREVLDYVNKSPLEEKLQVLIVDDNYQKWPCAPLQSKSPIRCSPENAEHALRKLVNRSRARADGLTVKILRPDELEPYFRLRYEVYRPLGYVPPETDPIDPPWEVHFSDRYSLPIGVFDKSKRLIACARLVYEFGHFNNYESVISKMIENYDNPRLKNAWELPRELTYPFDMLIPFPGFADYYRRLVQRRVSKAEVSRVVVHPHVQKQGLGELVVDSLKAVAMERHVQTLFLACQKKHAQFYGRSGFHLISGLECETFGTFPVAAVALEQTLSKS